MRVHVTNKVMLFASIIYIYIYIYICVCVCARATTRSIKKSFTSFPKKKKKYCYSYKLFYNIFTNCWCDKFLLGLI